jgi:carbon-monoxide dehydrogenase large subunit
LRGRGLSVYIESTGGAPSEFAEVEATTDGLIKAYVGTKSFGMGHETVFAQVLADELGIDFDRIRIIDGDTALVQAGFGSHGSRSMRIGGGALVLGTRKMIERGRSLAAEHLEVSPADIEYADGRFTITGTDRSIGLFELAEVASASGERLAGETMFETKNHAFANGCHACEVEVDPETGAVSIESHALIVDVGRVVNPLLTEGQLHGGIAQGLGQSVFERVVYDPESGQLMSGSFMDYALPRADELPSFKTAFEEVPCEDNPLGAKGAGEGPTTGCPPAVMNAVIDALSGQGIRHLDMPATPERVWRALRAAGGG